MGGPGRHLSKFAAGAVALAVLGGCSGLSGWKEPPPPDPNLYPKRYREQVADVLRGHLENPTGVRDAFISEPALKPVGQATQYVVCVRYNPRDSRQRYMGIREEAAIFLGGVPNQYLASRPEWCRDAAYQRYPEIEKMVP